MLFPVAVLVGYSFRNVYPGPSVMYFLFRSRKKRWRPMIIPAE